MSTNEMHALETKVAKYQTTIINNSLKEAASEHGLQEQLTEIIESANGIFTIDDDGFICSRDENGEIQLTEDGCDLLTPLRYVESLRETPAEEDPQSKGTEALLSEAVRNGDMKLYRQLRGRGPAPRSEEDKAKMAEAARRGDMKEYRRMRNGGSEGMSHEEINAKAIEAARRGDQKEFRRLRRLSANA